jgi:AraC family transcriptional regulator of adaptative response / DNA-3-methyladenine glycosylase II
MLETAARADAAPMPDPRLCEQARLSRDPRFDGLFFTAVTSTGIYCRPVCPAPAPKPANVRYYPSAAAAETAGFRPCLRCRPELAPGADRDRRGDAVVARALKLIDEGLLGEQPLAALAQRVHLGERQLRRLFVQRLGAAPVGVHGTRRLLFAKQLLTETALPITQVALAAGFGSLRRFNAVFQQAYRMPPRSLRRDGGGAPAGAGLSLRLGYRPPYDFHAQLAFLRTRALPGIEVVTNDSYTRAIGSAEAPAWLRLRPWPGGAHALRLELQGVAPAQLLAVVARVRRMFDLDADPQAIAAVLAHDARLRPLLRRRPGLRLPGGWDGVEIAVRAVLGQQVSVAAAGTLAARLARRLGPALPAGFPDGMERLFPDPQRLLDDDLDGLGLTGARRASVHALARALLDGRVDFNVERTLDEFVGRWTALPGIGPWTAQYIALRALSHPDAFPDGDLVLRSRLEPHSGRVAATALAARADAWRPWRAYAAIHLWHDAIAARADLPEPPP